MGGARRLEGDRARLFSHLPAPARFVVPGLVRRSTISRLKGQGLSAHSRAEIYAMGADDLHCLADQLSGRAFLFGDRPCSVDATAYAMLAQFFEAPVESPLKDTATALPGLVAYCSRMKERCFGS